MCVCIYKFDFISRRCNRELKDNSVFLKIFFRETEQEKDIRVDVEIFGGGGGGEKN